MVAHADDLMPVSTNDIEEDTAYLSYGDIVTFKCTDLAPGFIQADGFVDDQLSYQPISVKGEIPDNYVNCLFQIVPSFQYEASKERALRLEEMEKLQSSVMWSDDARHAQRQNRELRRLQEDEENERRINEEYEEKMRGRHVRYGESIQLRHWRSGRFVTINAKQLAVVERQNMRATVEDNGSEASRFTLAPRFRNRTEGELIFVDDPLIIMNTKLNTFLKVSKGKLPRSECYEANGSSQHSTFKFVPYFPFDPEFGDGSDYLAAPFSIRFHNEEASADLGAGERCGDRVFFRVPPGSGHAEAELHSSSEHFRVEFESIGVGGAGRFASRFRFRHLNTNCYLAIGDKYKRKKEEDDTVKDGVEYFSLNLIDVSVPTAESLFELVPSTLRDPSATIRIKDEKVRVRHCSSGFYLHVTSRDMSEDMEPLEPEFVRTSASDQAKRIVDDLKATFYEANLSQIRYDEDLFSIAQIPVSEGRSASFVRSARPALAKLVAHLEYKVAQPNPSADSTTLRLLRAARSTAGYLVAVVVESSAVNPLEAEGIPRPEMQQLMRECGMLDLLARSIELLFTNGFYTASDKLRKEGPEAMAYVQMAYHLLRHAFRSHALNEIYSSKWVEMMKSHVQYDFRAGAALTALLSDNFVLIESLSSDQTAYFVRLIKDVGKDPVFIMFLLSLCVCNEQAMKTRQEEVAKLILESEEGEVARINFDVDEKHDIFIREAVHGNDGEQQEPLLLTDILNRADEEAGVSGGKWTQYYSYIVNYVTLLGNLCFGGNAAAIEIVRAQMPFAMVLSLLQRTKFHQGRGAKLAAAFVGVMRHAFVVTNEAEKIRVPALSQVWSDLKNSMRTAPPEKALPHANDLIRFVHQYLQERENTLVTAVEEHELTAEVLSLTLDLLEHGQYTVSATVEYLMRSLTRILDGRSDFALQQQLSQPSSGRRGTIGGANASQNAVSRASSAGRAPEAAAGASAGGVMDGGAPSRFRVDERTKPVMDHKVAICEILFFIMELRADIRISHVMEAIHHRISEKEELAAPSEEEAAEIFEHAITETDDALNPRANSHPRSRLVPVLLDLCLYQYTPLVNWALRLLGRFFGEGNALLEHLQNVQVLTGADAMMAYVSIRRLLQSFQKKAGKLSHQPSHQLTRGRRREQETQAEQTGDVLERMTERIYGKGIGEIAEINAEDGEEAEKRPAVRQFVQRLMKNMGVHTEIIAMLRRNLVSHVRPAFEKAYDFLIAFARGNPENQEALYEHLGVFEGHADEDVHAMELIREIFYDNAELCRRLPDAVLDRFAQVINEHNRQRSILQFFRTIVYTSEGPVEENQGRVLRALKGAHGALLLCARKPDFTMRRKIMTDPEHEDGLKNAHGLLAYHLELIRLLYMTEMGNRPDGEENCRMLLSVKDFATTLSDDATLLPIRTAWAHLFRNVYLKGGASSEDLAKKTSMWNILEACASALEGFLEIMRERRRLDLEEQRRRDAEQRRRREEEQQRAYVGYSGGEVENSSESLSGKFSTGLRKKRRAKLKASAQGAVVDEPEDASPRGPPLAPTDEAPLLSPKKKPSKAGGGKRRSNELKLVTVEDGDAGERGSGGPAGESKTADGTVEAPGAEERNAAEGAEEAEDEQEQEEEDLVEDTAELAAQNAAMDAEERNGELTAEEVKEADAQRQLEDEYDVFASRSYRVSLEEDHLNWLVACAVIAAEFYATALKEVPADPQKQKLLRRLVGGVRVLHGGAVFSKDAFRHEALVLAKEELAGLAHALANRGAADAETGESGGASRKREDALVLQPARPETPASSGGYSSGAPVHEQKPLEPVDGAEEEGAEERGFAKIALYCEHEYVPVEFVSDSPENIRLQGAIDSAIYSITTLRRNLLFAAQEFEGLANAVREVEKADAAERAEGALTFDELLRGIVEHLAHNPRSTNAAAARENMRVVTLVIKLLSTLISGNNFVSDARSKEYEKNVRSEDPKLVPKIAMQTRLNDLGVSQLLLQVLSTTSDTALTLQGLKLARALLDGGNRDIQNTMLEFMEQQRRANPVERTLLFRLRDRFRAARHEIRSLRAAWRKRSRGGVDAHAASSGSQASARPVRAVKIERNMSIAGMELQALSTASSAEKSAEKSGWGLRGRSRTHKERALDTTSLQGTEVHELLLFMQLLCEGHNTDVQQYLRSQPGTQKSIDLVTELVSYLKKIEKHVYPQTIAVIKQGWITITEVMQGPCTENQEALMNAGIIESAHSTLRKQGTAISEAQLHALRIACTTSLLALLEEREGPNAVSLRMARTLDPEGLRAYLVRLHSAISQSKISQLTQGRVGVDGDGRGRSAGLFRSGAKSGAPASRTLLREEAFKIYILMKHLGDASSAFHDAITFDEVHVAHLLDKAHAKARRANVVSFRRKRGALSRLAACCGGSGGMSSQWDLADDDDDPLSTERGIHQTIEAMEFFESNTGRLEVLRDSQLYVEYFPVPRLGRFLTDETKDSFVQSLNRETPTMRLQDFLRRSTDLREEMVHQDRLSRFRPLSLLARQNENFKKIAYIVTVIINVLLVGTLESSQATTSGDLANLNVPGYKIGSWGLLRATDDTLDWLARLQLALQGIILLLHVLNNSNLHILRVWKGIRLNYVESQGASALVTEGARVGVIGLLRHGPPLKAGGRQTKKQLTLMARVVYILLSVVLVFTDGMFLYHLVSAGVAALGVFFNYAFFTFHLMDIMIQNETLKNVVRAVTYNWKQLVMTLILMVIIIYTYAVIAFFRFRALYILTDDSDTNEFVCENLLQCAVITLDQGLRNGGGIGDFAAEPGWNDAGLQYQGEFIAYKLSFFILIIVIMLNIIFGIIIDTFADLRDLKNERENDMQNFCSICGVERQEFDRHADGFEEHIKNDHNMWQYLYYIVHISTKRRVDLTGIEQYVLDSVNRQSISFFPLMRARALQGVEEEGDENDLLIPIRELIKSEMASMQAANMAELTRIREELMAQKSNATGTTKRAKGDLESRESDEAAKDSRPSSASGRQSRTQGSVLSKGSK